MSRGLLKNTIFALLMEVPDFGEHQKNEIWRAFEADMDGTFRLCRRKKSRHF